MSRLRRRMIEHMQIRNLAPHTQRAYVEQVVRFARHFRKSPERLGPAEIRTYQLYLANDRQLAASSIIVAVSALRFFYTVALKRSWVVEDDIPAGRQVKKLPVVLSQDEVARLLGAVENLKHRVVPSVTRPVCGFPKPSASRPPRSTASAWSSGLSRARGGRTAMSCCRPGSLICSGTIGGVPIPESGCSPVIRLASRSPRTPSVTPAGRRGNTAGSASRSRRIRCATPSPFTCWRPAPIYAPFSCCSEGRHTAHEHLVEGRIYYRFHPRSGETVLIKRRRMPRRRAGGHLAARRLACLHSGMDDARVRSSICAQRRAKFLSRQPAIAARRYRRALRLSLSRIEGGGSRSCRADPRISS